MELSRLFLFYFVCVPVRALLVYLAYNSALSDGVVKDVAAVGLTLAGIVFITMFFGNLREKALEGKDGIAWWAQYRLLIGLLYVCAGIYVYRRNAKAAAVCLSIDLLIGLTLTTANNFNFNLL